MLCTVAKYKTELVPLFYHIFRRGYDTGSKQRTRYALANHPVRTRYRPPVTGTLIKIILPGQCHLICYSSRADNTMVKSKRLYKIRRLNDRSKMARIREAPCFNSGIKRASNASFQCCAVQSFGSEIDLRRRRASPVVCE